MNNLLANSSASQDVKDVSESLLKSGYAITDRVVNDTQLCSLKEAAARVFQSAGGARAGIRGVLSQDSVFDELARSAQIRSIVELILGPAACSSSGIRSRCVAPATGVGNRLKLPR